MDNDTEKDVFDEIFEGLVLEDKQKTFSVQYAASLNQAKSYATVYGLTNMSSAAACGSRMLQNVNVKEAVSRILKSRFKSALQDIDEKLITTAITLATYDPADIVTKSGALKGDLDSLGDLSRAVCGIEQTKYGVKIKLADRQKYIELLAKYRKLISNGLDLPPGAEGAKITVEFVSAKDKDEEKETPSSEKDKN